MTQQSRQSKDLLDTFMLLAGGTRSDMHQAQIAWARTPKWRLIRRHRAKKKIDRAEFLLMAAEGAAVEQMRKHREAADRA